MSGECICYFLSALHLALQISGTKMTFQTEQQRCIHPAQPCPLLTVSAVSYNDLLSRWKRLSEVNAQRLIDAVNQRLLLLCELMARKRGTQSNLSSVTTPSVALDDDAFQSAIGAYGSQTTNTFALYFARLPTPAEPTPNPAPNPAGEGVEAEANGVRSGREERVD